jgi:hypothetical protein
MDIEEFYLHCLLNHGTPYQIDYITFWKVVWEVYDRDDLVPDNLNHRNWCKWYDTHVH